MTDDEFVKPLHRNCPNSTKVNSLQREVDTIKDITRQQMEMLGGVSDRISVLQADISTHTNAVSGHMTTTVTKTDIEKVDRKLDDLQLKVDLIETSQLTMQSMYGGIKNAGLVIGAFTAFVLAILQIIDLAKGRL